MEDKILGAENTSKAYIAGEGEPATTAASAASADVKSAMTASTKEGGLSSLPAGFDAADGYWKTILSDNPFEVLFLDYKQFRHILPETVNRNFDILNAFWTDKNKLLTGGSREKIKKRYTEDTVIQANKKLENCLEKLKTKEGINLYFKEIDSKRYANGIKAIEPYVRLSLADGELTKQESNTIISEALKNDLDEVEVRNFLYQELLAQNFKPTKNYPDIFDNHWMTNERKKMLQSRTTVVFGETVSTLEELGNVLFNNKEKAYNYLKNANYLPVEITKLQSSDKAMEFEEIINIENTIEKRFLKVVYHLNPGLPFVIDNETFETINHLFDKTSDDFSLFAKTSEAFSQGFLQIWLAESDPVNAAKLTAYSDYNNFLRFVFNINENHAFFLNHEKLANPLQLIKKAKRDKSYWSKISDAMINGSLPVWFTGIGKYEWIAKYNKQIEAFIDADYYSAEDKKLAAVQTLIQIIDPDAGSPKIIIIPTSVQLPAIEGSQVLEYPVLLKLQNEGFLKVKIFPDKVIEGIGLNVSEATFHSQSLATEIKVMLHIDALKLVKNKVYSFNIIVKTFSETQTLPVELKVIFPKKAYYLQLIKYAVAGAIFLGLIRFILGEITATKSWLTSLYDSYNGNNVPHNHFAYFIALFLFTLGLIGSFFIIRKIEKL